MNQLSEFENNLNVEPLAQSYLKETAKWSKFLAIVGFVLTGLMAIAGVFAGTMMTAFSALSPELGIFPAGGFTLIYLVIAAFYFFPCLYLFQMSQKLVLAIESQDSEQLTWALEKQKSLFKFVGICTLVMVILYGGILLFALLGGGLAMMFS